jgi:hypothetical protein
LLAELVCAFAAVGAATGAEPPRCPGIDIAVPRWSAAERDRLCSAAREALAFLRDAGLAPEGRLTIEPLDEPPKTSYGSEIGHFDVARNEIRVLPLRVAMGAPRLDGAFGVPMTPALWAGYVGHEVAHAVAERHFAPDVARFTASEYIAAVVQMETMEPPLRAAILARFADLEAYRSVEAISSLYYQMAPGQFAVKVYLHYLDLGDGGPEFLHWLLRNGLPK